MINLKDAYEKFATRYEDEAQDLWDDMKEDFILKHGLTNAEFDELVRKYQ